jgi:putative OPT family oligopeptide transporter
MLDTVGGEDGVLGWKEFKYMETTAISITGGLLGILFSVPIRRAVFGILPPLRFPEAVACAEVLKAGAAGTDAGGVVALLAGGSIGALTKFCMTGLILCKDTIGGSFFLGGGAFQVNLLQASPAIFGVGYIVGMQTAATVTIGGLCNWLVAIPAVSAYSGWDDEATFRAASGSTAAFGPVAVSAATFSQKTRFLAIGMMLTGTLHTFSKLYRPLKVGIKAGIASARALSARPQLGGGGGGGGDGGGVDGEESGGGGRVGKVPRTEQDLDLRVIGALILVSYIPLVLIFDGASESLAVSAAMGVFLLITGFVMSAIAAYLAGLLGSGNSPISGVTVITVLASSLLLRFVFGADELRGPATAIIMGSVIACAAAISGDNMQDLKTGHLLGATPWRQQVMQSVGVVCTSFVFAPVLNLMQQVPCPYPCPYPYQYPYPLKS